MTLKPTTPPADDVRALLGETQRLLATAIKDGAARLAALHRAEPDDDLEFFARIRDGLNDTKIEYAARSVEQQRADQRAICKTLLLPRACPRAACRRTRACRGNPEACRERAGVPAIVEDYATMRMLAKLMPWAPLRGSAAQRQAYACWIAGIEAGTGRNASPIPRSLRSAGVSPIGGGEGCA